MLPENASASVIDAFLAICVHIISTVKPNYSNRAIKILFGYLKNGNILSLTRCTDQKVFNRFKVNRLIVRKMKLVEYMFCKYLSLTVSLESGDRRPRPRL